MNRSLSLAAVLAFGAFSPGAAPPQEDATTLDEVEASYLNRLRQFEERKDWKGLFEWAARGRKNFGQKVVRGEKDVYTGLSEHLLVRLSRLPREAHDFYRLEHDGRARAEFDRAREKGDRRMIEKAVDEYFFSSYADEGLDTLGALSFEEGALDEAIFHWNRLLRLYPGSDLPRAVTAARIAHACSAAGNEAALEDLFRYVSAEGLDGPLVVGARPATLREFLSGLRIAPPAPVARPTKAPPHVRGWDEVSSARNPGVRNEIRRWTYDFEGDRKESLPAGAAVAAPEVPPCFPACARIRGREYVIFSDGTRVVAVDPSRVRSNSPTAGVYWIYPRGGPLPRVLSAQAQALQQRFQPPFVGVTVEGEHAFVTLYAVSRSRDPNPGNQDYFEGPAAVKCIHIPTGKLVWDTDASPLTEVFRELVSRKGSGFEFYDQDNYAFSSPVVVRGGRVYVGVCTSPMRDQESRVLCLDRKTGRPLWCTYLAYCRSGMGNRMFGMNRAPITLQTLLEEQGGVVYAATNLGAVAALDGVTGGVLWLSRYARVSYPRDFRGMNESIFSRAPSRPLVWNGTVIVLPQDREDLLVFDRLTGRPAETFSLIGSDKVVPWRTITYLVGLVEDQLVVGGTTSYFVNLRKLVRPPRPADVPPGVSRGLGGAGLGSLPGLAADPGADWVEAVRSVKEPNANSLVSSNVVRAGRGTIDGTLVYLPVQSGASGPGQLAVYDTVTKKVLDACPWRGEVGPVNLLVAGGTLVTAGFRQVSIYTDTETLKGEFVHRLHQSPPHVESLLEFGDVMRENQRLEDAAEAYLAFIRAAEGDPRHEERALKVRGELHSIFLRQGEEAASRGDAERALQHYGTARRFAPGVAAEAEALRRMAEQNEKLRRWKDAVALYQELIEKGRDQIHREAEGASRVWDVARRKIAEIVEKAPDAYAEIEARAAAALREAGEKGAGAFRDVMDRFPNSGAAQEAWRRLIDALRKEGRYERLRSLFDEFRERFRRDLDFGTSREMLEALEKAGDMARYRHEVARFAERFPAERMGGEGGGETAKEFAERRLRETRPAPAATADGPLAKKSEMEPPKIKGTVPSWFPLRPLGVEPPRFPPGAELFECGAGVELRDLRGWRLLWAFRLRPGEPAEGEPRPRLVGSAYTRDGALAVAWEDGAAAIDLASGRELWRFAGIREKCSILGFHATDGRIYLYEGAREGRGVARARVRSDDQAQRAVQWLQQRRMMELNVVPPVASGAPGEYEQLLCLNDSSGALSWSRIFPGDPGQPSQVSFHGPYLAEHAGVLHWGPSGWQLLILASRDGAVVRKDALPHQVQAYATDPSGSVFYYVASMGDQSLRSLRSLPLDPARRNYRPVEISLRNHLQPGHQACRLEAGAEHLCLIAPPFPPASEYRIWVFRASDGKLFRSVSLLEGRTLPSVRAQAPAVTAMDGEGILYVYNVSREGPGAGEGARSYLTAFRVGTPEGANVTAWDAPAPSMGSNGQGWLVPVASRYLIFAAAQAWPPGQRTPSTLAVVYDRGAEGYIRGTHSDLRSEDPGGGRCPVAWWRGRLFVSTGKSLQVWGP
jgi:outer membrane protein assembly factor BamB/tetratricopeptide (TPR) repeat protein